MSPRVVNILDTTSAPENPIISARYVGIATSHRKGSVSQVFVVSYAHVYHACCRKTRLFVCLVWVLQCLW